uniref:Mannosyl-oligosaccharide glucosidase n=1 Tax=Strigamia maritima TaxID=126957 RepID=T1ISH0_STRMM
MIMVRQRRPLKPESEEARKHREKKKRNNHQPKTLTKKILSYLFLSAAVFVALSYLFIQYSRKIQVVTPLKQPLSVVQSGVLVPDKFWGTYRPNCYFGLKARSPQSPIFGLMWFAQTLVDNQLPLRHWCEQGDRLLRYGWLEHDITNFGRQEIEETHYRISTDFVKRSGGNHGGDWTTRITFSPKGTKYEPFISLIFYLALDGQGRIQPVLRGTTLATVQGDSEELGPFRVSYETSTSNIKMTSYLMTVAPGMHLLKETVLKNLAIFQLDKLKHVKVIGLVGNQMKGENEGKRPNFLAYQAVFTLPFEIEVVFESGSFADRPNRLIGDVFTSELAQHSKQFHERFAQKFKLQDKGYKPDQVNFAKAAMSNLLGGIGYFYGSSIVQSQFNAEPVKYWPAPLYTAVPSRSFFPRGFLWDEGFHNLLICQFDTTLCKDIIAHWLDLMNVEGWIPREQILGAEARSKVPDEFVVQQNTNANPPTLFLTLQYLINKLQVNNSSIDEHDFNFFRRIYPRLMAWFDWFNVTQIGKITTFYRWRGRDAVTIKELNPKTLSSGLDDYPRASHPTEDERHVDLRCWMALAADVMSQISKFIGISSDKYKKTYKLLSDNDLLDELHWSPELEAYSDFGYHSSKTKLERPKVKNIQPGKPAPKADKIRVVIDEPKLQFVDSFGYVSLFPFITLILSPDSPKLAITLNRLKDPDLLWTKFGLRSLAKSNPLYMKHNTEHDPPYWRGAIWININFLTLRALYHYSALDGPSKEISRELYKELKRNLVENIYNEYKRSGYVWEQYSDLTGQGQGSHPFTGWTSLIVLIMGDTYW